MNKILIVNVNWLGDVIFSSPVFKALKAAYPECQITCLAPPRVKGILKHVPFVDDILIYDEEGEHVTPFGKLKMIRLLRKNKFDAAFILHKSFTRALLVFLAGIPLRIGYPTKGRGFLLTHKVKMLDGNVHRSDEYLHVIESFGVEGSDRSTSLVSNKEIDYSIERKLVKNGINPEDFLVVINPGGNWDLKKWPRKQWSLLIKSLLNKKDVKIAISGAKKDLSLAQAIVGKDKDKIFMATGQTNLSEVISLMKRADVVVSADSGPLHIANSLGTHVVGLFGPTLPQITGPRGYGNKKILRRDVGCNLSACYHLRCHDNICMNAVTVEDVMEAIFEIKGVSGKG